MGLREMFSSILYGTSHHMDPVERQSSLLCGEVAGNQRTAGNHECICASASGILERSHLRRNIMECL
jgi:hypothetical protein